MTIICNKYLSTRDFSYSKQSNTFVAEISELSIRNSGFGRVYDDACDEGFVLVSHKTGDSVVVALDTVDMNGEDIAGWRFKVIAKQGHVPGGWIEIRNPSSKHDFKVLVIND